MIFHIILFPLLFLAVLSINGDKNHLLEEKALKKIDSGFFEELKQFPQQKSDVILTFADTAPILQSLQSGYLPNTTDSERAYAAFTALNQFAAQSQSTTLEFLSSQNGLAHEGYHSHWSSNEIFVKGANRQLVHSLSRFSEIESINKNTLAEITLSVEIKNGDFKNESRQGRQLEWGIQKINADYVWDYGGRHDGRGIIIGVIDSGVRSTHERLRNNFVGVQNYGWRDPVSNRREPFDDLGHGTHCTGTCVGTNGIGVAPGAQWMACRGFGNNNAVGNSLRICMDWMACPSQGRNGRCSGLPKIINNSWRDTQGFDYSRQIDAWQNANIIPVFAGGNDGRSGCYTITRPGDSDRVITVGNTNVHDQLNETSSRGPTQSGLRKPDISAPGTLVRSAYHRFDSDYVEMTGTSMAAPHVSGLIALMLNKSPHLNFHQIKQILEDTANKQQRATGDECGGLRDSNYPNNHFGAGRVAAWDAVSRS